MVYTKVSAADSERIQEVLERYALRGEKMTVARNTLANVNRVFLVKAGSRKYILRESNPSTAIAHLHLEAEILRHLAKKKFRLTPHLIPNSAGDFVTVHRKKSYTLQTLLPGEARESVSNLVRFNDAKLISFFKMSAEFTRAIQDFDGKPPRENKPLSFYAKNGTKILRSLIRKIPHSPVKQLLLKDEKFLDDFGRDVAKQMKVCRYDEQPKQIVHFDIHPGNVNYLGDKVSGLFDFDWARWDCRLTDLACTIGQSCYSYRGKDRARYNSNKIKLGLKTYRITYGKSEYGLPTENRLLRVALKGYMLYQLFWIIEWYLLNLDKPDKGLRHVTFSIDVLKSNYFIELIG